ncbi:MAG TPA: mannose-1-phosphate guanylyltransferase, partial [Cellvibrio sp.]|nr:mannose-1-phosphate guanylyltransferase [Cellvibrio sp.]
MIIPVILAGGSGSRLWPLSRQHYPKQLLKLFGDKTMLQQTILRLTGLTDLSAPIVVCNVEHRFMVAEQLNEIGSSESAIILEPLARNTAPALALAALHAREIDAESMLLVLSADHMISNVEEFQRAVNIAKVAAAKNHLVTFGVHPTHPETGYGYIKTSQVSSDIAEAFAVEQFVEKPDLQTAQSYLAAGCYYWNSGMFVFKTDVFLSELQVHSPEVVASADQARTWAVRDLDFIRVDKESFAQAPNISIDYALMEKSNNV